MNYNSADQKIVDSLKNKEDFEYPQRETTIARNLYLETMENRRRNLYLSLLGGLAFLGSRKLRTQLTIPGCYFMGSFVTFAVVDYPTDMKLHNMSKIINRQLSNRFNDMMEFREE